MEGRTVSHYKVLNRLGRGGMGVVYRAEDRNLGRPVALKFLTAELDEVTPDARERFFREARAASALDHPRICTVYEVGQDEDGRPFIAMAYCAGETLRERILRGPIPFDEARAITIQIAEGLAAAHEAGVVHRDIKPAYIMLTPGGVKILDFGLAKLSDVSQMTQTGATLGTPAYMSPEQAKGEKVDPRSDIWSLAAIVYEMVNGRRAFYGNNPTAIMFVILSQGGVRAGVGVAGPGAFREAGAVLESLQPQLEAEQVREAMALAVRGDCEAELGNTSGARKLIARAIDRSPGVPTRDFFTRGLLDLRRGDLAAARATAAAITAGAQSVAAASGPRST